MYRGWGLGALPRGRQKKGSGPQDCSLIPTLVLPPLRSSCFGKQMLYTSKHAHPHPHALPVWKPVLRPMSAHRSPALLGPAPLGPSGPTEAELGGLRRSMMEAVTTKGQFWNFSEPSLGLFPQLQSGQSLLASPTLAPRHRDR